jgi:hypothetical protein
MEELDGSAVSAHRRAIVEAKQRWSVIGWVTKNVLIIKLFVLAVSAGLSHVLLMCDP